MAELKQCKCGKIQKINCESNSYSPTYKVYWAACEDCDMYACAYTEQELVNSWNSYIKLEQGGEMKELEPCPFCGRKAVLLDHVHITSQNRYTIGCEDECCIGHYVGYPMNEQQAIDAWNRREK